MDARPLPPAGLTRVLAAALACACLLASAPASDAADQEVTLRTTFAPDRLRTPTTIEFGFRIRSTIPGRAPSPVTSMSLYLPAGMGLATSTLGLAQCEPSTLGERGPEGCPANAQVGDGTAQAEMIVGDETIDESATIHALLGPPAGENERVLFYVEAVSPVDAHFVFPSQILPATGRYGGRLETTVPLIPTWTDGPDISLISFSSTIGPRGLTYYRHVRDRIVPFHPRGIGVPAHCPREGFPFRAEFTFQDATRASATSAVPCPAREMTLSRRARQAARPTPRTSHRTRAGRSRARRPPPAAADPAG